MIGSIILVVGAAWPVATTGHPVYSRKNQLFAIGNLCMFAYAMLRFAEGGPPFFILLQALVMLSTLLMMLDTDDRCDATLIAVSGMGLTIYAFFLFQGMQTVIFVAGLCILGVGFAMDMASVWRQVMLTVGSVLIAWYSVIVGDGVFLWLNIFFALCSSYYVWKHICAVGRSRYKSSAT